MAKVKGQSHRVNVKSMVTYRAYAFSRTMIEFIELFVNKRINWCIIDQLIRSSTSIGANLIEAKSASSKRDFIKYYEIALKSANETKYWLCLLRDTRHLNNRELCSKLLKEAVEISNMIGAALLTLKNKNL